MASENGSPDSLARILALRTTVRLAASDDRNGRGISPASVGSSYCRSSWRMGMNLARRMVERATGTASRLVEDQQLGAMQQGPGQPEARRIAQRQRVAGGSQRLSAAGVCQQTTVYQRPRVQLP